MQGWPPSWFLAYTDPAHQGLDPPILLAMPLGLRVATLISDMGSCVFLRHWAGLTLTSDSEQEVTRTPGSLLLSLKILEAEVHILLGVEVRTPDPRESGC